MDYLNTLYQSFLNCGGISTDTRSLSSGEIFFALKGDNFDGNEYALKALQAGASIVVIDDELVAKSLDSEKFFLVEDVLKTLQALARLHRSHMNFPVLAITGTNGKTTTKELIAEIVAKSFNVHATKGNLNNHIGVPLTILSTPKKCNFLIVEMGANHMFEIDELCKIADPNFGVITNIGKAHLEGFGSVENILKTKTELYRHVADNNGTLFVNENDEMLISAIPDNANVIRFNELDSKLVIDKTNGFVAVERDNETYKSQLVGKYNFWNIAYSLTIGDHFNVPSQLMKEAIENYAPKLNRSQYKRIENRSFILDAYNANPTSMKNSISSFSELDSDNKILVLGEMKEMGDAAKEEHQKLLDIVKGYNWAKVFLVGEIFEEITSQAEYIVFESITKLLENIDQSLLAEDGFYLIKGSRSNRMERFMELFDE